MCYKEVISGVHIVAPDLHPVTLEEIEEHRANVRFPSALIDCWTEIGCGAFTRGNDGTRLTDFQNRLVGPDEIADLRTDAAFPEGNPFDLGIPFFETADLRFLVLRENGAVVHQGGAFIACSLEDFLSELVARPLFWLDLLE